ncbi:hypothetical protein [Desulfogranum japonicum]|uniref:hypothetical protein n=1 Tax=Desulfogranum japonicum TaxID=231447 RepID=UPI00041C36F8|nr:hypothetical protein [Desulfogranum japonicum]
MDPATLIPAPDALPVHWSWFYLLLLVTFFLHIVLMNIMLGTAFIATATHLWNTGGDSPVCESAAKGLPYSIALTVNFGVAPLLFVQVLFGHLVYTSSILMAVYWLWIIGILIAAYYLAYIYKYRYHCLVGGRFLLTGAITLLLLLIGFFFTNNFTLMLNPAQWSRYFDNPGGFILNTGDPTLLPRYLHFMTSAVAVGGLSLAVWFSWKQKKGSHEASHMITRGCQWFAGATLINAGFGAWFLGSIPHGMLSASGSVTWFTILLMISILFICFAVIFALREQVYPAVISALPAIFFMILVRDQLRSAYLHPWFSPSDLPVHPQYSPLFLFLAVLLGGLVLVGWMLKLVLTAETKGVQS